MTGKFSFTVMTMNLRFGLAKDGEDGWDHRRPLLERFLSGHQADVMGFQEVNHFQADVLEKRLNQHDHRGRYNPQLPWWQSNPIFFSKDWKCKGFRHYFLSETPDIPSKLSGSRWPRQCVAAWLETGGNQLLAVNTHFDFDPRVQAKSAGLVLDLLEDFPPGLPVVITGDFNADPCSPAFEVFRAGGFKEVFEGRGPGTYHGFSGIPDGRHIDWILFRGDIRPGVPQVLDWEADGRFPSDHFPVACEFFLG